MEIGRLEEVDLRQVWNHEQYDFSEWLAKEENISLLNNILGLTLTNISKEVYVGTYRCDIFAVDEVSGTRVIIENQLEQSNHDHLGKIITYASGLDAEVIVWIVKDAREEHRSAIEWLNNNTNNKINFFLLEIKAYKIGDSKPAPYFNIIEKPNDFIKNTKNSNESETLNKSQADRLEFWNMFNDKLIEKGKPFNVRNATISSYYDIAIGSSGVSISMNLVNSKSLIYIGLYINDDKRLFDKLYDLKDDIEKELGLQLIWDRNDNNKSSMIKYNIMGLNFDDHSNYDDLMNKMIDIDIKMINVFKKYL